MENEDVFMKKGGISPYELVTNSFLLYKLVTRTLTKTTYLDGATAHMILFRTDYLHPIFTLFLI